MNAQLDMFAPTPPTVESREDQQRNSWLVCWGWDGPVAGEMCTIDGVIVERAAGGRIYAYMEKARLIELRSDGKWLAEIAMGDVHGQPWRKDGTRVLLGICDIWPPMDEIRASRAAA